MRDGAVDHGGVACDGCGDGHFFDAAGEAGKQGAFGRQCTDVNGVEAGLIDNDWNFNARTLWQIGDEIRVANVTIEFEHLAAFEGIDDISRIFMFAL